MSRMNITADPGLLYNMSELFTINITKREFTSQQILFPLVHLTETRNYIKTYEYSCLFIKK